MTLQYRIPRTDLDAVETPQVSVIVPFLNAERFLEETVESVLAQSFSAWELLLIDDGSSDGSTAIAQRYAARFPGRIVYLEHPGHQNRGVAAARNLGIRHARGEFLAPLDADDVWLPNKLAEQVPLLEAHPEAGMLYGNSLFWHSWTRDPRDSALDHQPPLGVPLQAVSAPPEILTRLLERKAAAPCPCSILARRAIVEQVGGFEESMRTVLEDQAFLAKMFMAAPAYVASRTWDKYRIHPDSACAVTDRAGRFEQARLDYLEWLGQYLRDRGLARGRLWRAFRLEHWRCWLASRLPGVARFRRQLLTAAARLRAAIPKTAGHRIRRRIHPAGGVRFGNLRRVVPISRYFGLDRGHPVDRHYIATFLARHAADVRGRVLEIGDDSYTRQYGGDRVTVRDVLHVDERNPHATIVDDLAAGDRIPSNSFDCVILTQTLHLVYDVHTAARTLHRILKPGGVLLLTVPGISQLDIGEWNATWFWSFTPASVRRLFEEQFPAGELQVVSFGNVLASCAFLHGLASEELSASELAAHDPLYPMVVGLRARKPIAEAS
jgi:glycosyltransferase involved in cell wall biosynthesis